jgi:hypothetical protein
VCTHDGVSDPAPQAHYQGSPHSDRSPWGSPYPIFGSRGLTIGDPCLISMGGGHGLGQGEHKGVCLPKTYSLLPTQFFLILLLIFIAEIAAAVVALVYTTMVRHWDGAREEDWAKSGEGWAMAYKWPPSLPAPKHWPVPPRLSNSWPC